MNGQCEVCSEHHALTGELQEGGRGVDRELCQTCWTDETFRCPDCSLSFWNSQGTRVFGTPELYCDRCAKQYPHVAASLARAAGMDVDRDDFNERRR